MPESGPGISGPSGPPSGPSIPRPPSGPSGPTGPSGPFGPSGPPIKPSYDDIEPGVKPSYLRPYRPIPKPDRKPGYLSDPGYRPPYGVSGQDFGFRPPRPTKPYIPVNEVEEPCKFSFYFDLQIGIFSYTHSFIFTHGRKLNIYTDYWITVNLIANVNST